MKMMKYYVDRRLEDLYALQRRGEDLGNIQPPTPEEAQLMVQYADCLFCGQKWPRKELYMPVMCPDCRSLLEYCISMLGEPKKAMDTIYEALKFYQEHKLKQKYEEKREPEKPVEEKAEVKSEEKDIKSKILELIGLDEEDIKLLAALKKLRKEGLL